MKIFHAISETLIIGAIALGSLVFVLAALAHALSHIKIM
jgi:hypothetical protein